MSNTFSTTKLHSANYSNILHLSAMLEVIMRRQAEIIANQTGSQVSEEYAKSQAMLHEQKQAIVNAQAKEFGLDAPEVKQ